MEPILPIDTTLNMEMLGKKAITKPQVNSEISPKRTSLRVKVLRPIDQECRQVVA